MTACFRVDMCDSSGVVGAHAGALDSERGVHHLVNDKAGFGAPKEVLAQRYPNSVNKGRYLRTQDGRGRQHAHQDRFDQARRSVTRFTTRGRGSEAGTMRFYVARIYGGEAVSALHKSDLICELNPHVALVQVMPTPMWKCSSTTATFMTSLAKSGTSRTASCPTRYVRASLSGVGILRNPCG
jgi:hypothetical protein